MAIRGGSGKPKHVAHHDPKNKGFGVILTPADTATIRTQIVAERAQIAKASEKKMSVKDTANKVFSKLDKAAALKLSNKITTIIAKRGRIGYFRDCEPSMKNLATALKIYGETGNLHQRFTPETARGQGASHIWPSTVYETFVLACTDGSGIMRTIEASKIKDPELSKLLEFTNAFIGPENAESVREAQAERKQTASKAEQAKVAGATIQKYSGLNRGTARSLAAKLKTCKDSATKNDHFQEKTINTLVKALEKYAQTGNVSAPIKNSGRSVGIPIFQIFSSHSNRGVTSGPLAIDSIRASLLEDPSNPHNAELAQVLDSTIDFLE